MRAKSNHPLAHGEGSFEEVHVRFSLEDSLSKLSNPQAHKY